MLSSKPWRRWHTIKDLRTSSSRTDGVIFHDADWLAGVDYEDEDEDEDEHEEMPTKMKSTKTVKNRT